MDMNLIAAARLSKIRAKISGEGIDSLLLTSPENVSYCTLFSGDDSWVLVSKKKVWLLTDSRYTEQAAGECIGCEWKARRGRCVCR